MYNELFEDYSGDCRIDFPPQIHDFCQLQGNGNKEEIFFYSGNHLSSTMMVTDYNGDIAQAIMYAPFGQIIAEYNALWHQDIIPNFTFNAKPLDEESGLMYYDARYYDPSKGVYNSRDVYFEKQPWMSPYAYCFNNPMRWIDPTGIDPEDPPNTAGQSLSEVVIRAQRPTPNLSPNVRTESDKTVIPQLTPQQSIPQGNTPKEPSMPGGINWSSPFGEGRGPIKNNNAPTQDAPFSAPKYSVLKDLVNNFFGKIEATPTPTPESTPELEKIHDGWTFNYRFTANVYGDGTVRTVNQTSWTKKRTNDASDSANRHQSLINMGCYDISSKRTYK